MYGLITAYPEAKRTFLLLLALSLFLPGCAAARGTSALSKGTQGVKTSSKSSQAAKKGTKALGGAEGLRQGSGAKREIQKAMGSQGLKFVVVRMRQDDRSLSDSAGKALDLVTQTGEFQNWVKESVPEKGRLSGEGAPKEVGDAFLEAFFPAQALSKPRRHGDRFWMQWYLIEEQQRIAVYDPVEKTVSLLRPGAPR